MIQRAEEDRRVNKVKVSIDRRKFKRRKEDRDNVISYYVVLGASVVIFGFITVISIVWGM